MDVLEQQYETLKQAFPGALLERRSNGSALVTIPEFHLPAGWNAQTTTVLFVAPVGYPIARPDCFWTDVNLRLASGAQPTNTQLNSNYGGPEPRLWFSFHPSLWNPNADNLVTYARIIGARFRNVR